MNVANMPGMYFLDTNIFVYSFDSSAPTKQEIARDSDPKCTEVTTWHYQ